MENQNGNGKKGNTGALVACSIAGLCAGAAIGLLFAPKPGKETRAAIAEKVKSWRESAKR